MAARCGALKLPFSAIKSGCPALLCLVVLPVKRVDDDDMIDNIDKTTKRRRLADKITQTFSFALALVVVANDANTSAYQIDGPTPLYRALSHHRLAPFLFSSMIAP